MNPIAMEHNLRRLTFFLHVDFAVPLDSLGWEEFLATYARIMDIHGDGRNELSRLYLEKDDFDELKSYAIKILRPIPENDGIVVDLKYLSFFTTTIRWHVYLIDNYFERKQIY